MANTNIGRGGLVIKRSLQMTESSIAKASDLYLWAVWARLGFGFQSFSWPFSGFHYMYSPLLIVSPLDILGNTVLVCRNI